MTRLRPFGCAYDSYGRITQKASRNIHYHDAARPHWPSEVHAGTTTTPVAHDLNGNRTRAKGGDPDYTYDAWDRLATIAVPGTGSVSFVHDYSGRRAAKVVSTFLGPGITFYYSDLAELSGNQLFKSYYLGGLRVASQRKTCTSCELAALTPTEAVRLAAVSLKSPALVVLLRRDVELALAAALVLFGTGVLLAPWKRRRVVGITLRHGQVIVVAVFFLSGTFPWPILLRPAEAQCGNPPTPTPGPTPTATPVSVGEVRHYHVDHLGSVQVVTDAAGAMVEQIRYQPYGEVRGRFDGLGNPITNPSAAYRYEFTGYESEILSGLQYAGARFYDPTLGLFLTQDPAAQFASPYTYTGWDPVNLTDPNGEFAWLIPLIKFAIVGFAVGFAVSAIQAGINGAPAGAALKAGLIGGALGAATGAVLGPIGTAVSELAKPIVSLAYNLALTGLGGYGAYQGITTGNYLVAAVAMVGVAFGVKGAFDATKQLLARAPGGVNSSGSIDDRFAAMQSDLDPAQATGNSALSDEQVGNIIFNETRSLSGSGIDSARAELAHTIINADETWGPLRSLHARTAPSTLPRNFSPALEGGTLQSIRATVAEVRWARSLGIDPTRGATNFNLRAYPSPRPPSWAASFRLQAIHGGFANSIGPPQYIHIWQNPNAGYPYYGL